MHAQKHDNEYAVNCLPIFKGENLHTKGPHLWRAVDMHRIMILSNQACQGPGTQGL